MRCSILVLASLVMCASAQRNDAQPASQEDINRALEVLHKTPAVAPPPVAKPGVALKITSTVTNASPAAATPVRTQVQPPPTSSSPMTQDMERRAREVLNGAKADQRTQPAPNPAREAIERANANDQARKQAVEETRRGLPQTNSNQPATLAQEQQQKAQQEIDRQKNLERIELEVQRARLARQQKAAAQSDASKTNAPASAVAAAQTNAPAKTVTNAPAPIVAAAKTNAPMPKVAPVAPTATAPTVALTPVPAPTPAVAPQPIKPAGFPAQPVVTPQPIAPAPVFPAQPVVASRPDPVIAQPTPAPAPVLIQAPAPRLAVQTNGAFKALAPDMEQRARGILDQVISNTKGATLPVLATEPPRPTPSVPAPQAQAETPAKTPPAPAPPAPVKGPDVAQAPAVVATPAKDAVAKPMQADQEAKARELLNQLLAQPGAPTATPPVQKPAPAIVEKQPTPAPTPAPAVQQRQPSPAPTVATKAPASTPMAPDQEAKARALLNQTLSTLPAATPAPAPAPVASKPIESPKPATAPEPAPSAPIVTKAPTPGPQSQPVSTLQADREAKARELLNQTLSTLPAPTTAHTPSSTVETKITPDMDRRAQEDARRQAKLKAEIEEQTRREIARMEEESQARAREMAKRRMEEEKRAQNHKSQPKAEVTPVAAAKPSPAAVRNNPEPVESQPTAKSAEKPKRVKTNGEAKPAAKTPVQETWKDSGKPREQRLSELLDAYRKDQISAERYHSERAKILATSQ